MSRPKGSKATKKFTRNTKPHGPRKNPVIRSSGHEYENTKSYRMLDKFTRELNHFLKEALANPVCYSRDSAITHPLKARSANGNNIEKIYGKHALNCFRNFFYWVPYKLKNKNGEETWSGTWCLKFCMIIVAKKIVETSEKSCPPLNTIIN